MVASIRPVNLLSPVGSADVPTILDLEASGFGRDSYPIEVGYVLPDGSSFCTLIRPAPGWTHWDPAAEQIHHIRRDALVKHGRDVGEVARLLNDQLHGLTVFSDGWAHDYPWLSALYESAGLQPSFKLDSLRRLLNEQQAQDWHATLQSVSNELQAPRHRASADARRLQLTLQRVRSAPPLTPQLAG
jgi:hypothetical protein